MSDQASATSGLWTLFQVSLASSRDSVFVETRSDAQLLGLMTEGDELALRELVERHSAWLLLRLRRRTADQDLAAEALHDTFVAVWRKPEAFRGDGDVGAWLWGIAIRQLVTRLRKRGQPTPVTGEVIAALSPAVRSAEDELLVAVEHGPMGDALRTLSPEHAYRAC